MRHDLQALILVWAAVEVVAALIPGNGDHRPADARDYAGGRAITGGAHRAANDWLEGSEVAPPLQ